MLPRIGTLLEVMAQVGRAHGGKSHSQVALNWLLQRPGVTAPILGARTPAHLEDNLGATGWNLSAEHMDRLDQASAQPLPYPYESLARQQASRGR